MDKKIELEFKMADGLIIRGTIEGDITSDNLVVMLHSGGYDRHERGVKEVKKNPDTGKKEIEYYNMLGNYDYLTNYIKQDGYCVFRIDQRNHGQSGKNIDSEKIRTELTALNIEDTDIEVIITALLERDEKVLNEFSNKSEALNRIIKRPPLKDMSFVQMKDDFAQVMTMLPEKIGKNFQSIDYIGTCMGTIVLGLYLNKMPEKANSLTLFSPLYTFEYSFTKPPANAGLVAHKKEVIDQGKQFRLGNAVEGPSTYTEIEKISKDFIQKIAVLNIPTLCIQGLNDTLVSANDQRKIFGNISNYRKNHNLSNVYYAEIQAVHCLYDAIFPEVLEISNFLTACHTSNEKTNNKTI